MREYLEHLRLVHFALLLVLGTALYISLAGWSESRSSSAELTRLSNEIDRLAMAPDQPRTVAAITSGWDSVVMAPLRRDVQANLGGPISLSEESYYAARVISHAPSHPSTYPTLESYRTARSATTWVLEVVDTIKTDWSSVRREMARYFGERPQITRPIVTITVEDWGAPGVGALGSMRFDLQHPLKTPNDSDRRGITVRRMNVEFITRIDSVYVPPDGFSKAYPNLMAHWDSLGSRSLPDAIRWARRMRFPELVDRDPEILGVTVEGEHVAIATPILLICLLIYLLSYLGHLVDRLKLTVVQAELQQLALSPWIGVVPNRWARLICWATLVVLPSFVTAILVWNQLRVPFPIAIVIASIIASLGVACVRLAETIRDRFEGL